MVTRDSSGGVALGVDVITPNDGANTPRPYDGLNVDAAGTVTVDTEFDTNVSVFVAAGVAFPLRVTKVYATGTSATGIRGLYR